MLAIIFINTTKNNENSEVTQWEKDGTQKGVG